MDKQEHLSVEANRNHSPKLEELLQEVEQLPTEERAQLMKWLLGKQNGVNIVFGHLSGSIAIQINTMDSEQLGDLLRAIAQRIVAEGKP